MKTTMSNFETIRLQQDMIVDAFQFSQRETAPTKTP